ncbi:1-acyl-sn-glycerol-3-phosphate acyltransferase [Campylobacterota bacterium]|nr:1-acyl-sn-glycerol-3-phosphate acyltransferase [Campylobacterota bacterium]
MRFRSFLFLLGYIPIMLCVSLSGSLLGVFLPMKARFWFPKAAFYAIAFCLQITCNIRWRLEGRENLPREGTFVVAANHQCAWETYALQTLIVPLCTVLKRELLWIPIFGWALAFLRPIAIDRASAIKATKKVLKTGADRLHNGISVLIFPEGTRAPIGVEREFKRSAAHLAKEAGVPVVPIAHNAGECWQHQTLLKRSGTIVISVGEPIATEGRSIEEIHALYTSWIKAEMKNLASG